jgi:predicted GNAT family N-acyltransferase
MSAISESESSEKGTPKEWTTYDILSPGLAFGRLSAAWLPETHRLLHSKIAEDAASLETMRAVHRQNSDSFWGLFQQTGQTHELVGFYCQLTLNEAGHDALLKRTINLKKPHAAFLCDEGDPADAIYVWAMLAERKLDIFRPMLARSLARYSGIAHYATLATEAGRKAGRTGGMRPVTPQDDRVGGLFVLKLGYAHRVQAPPQPSIRVMAVTGADQLEQVRAIRAVVFMGEQKCPYAEEFDGNDCCATHILGFVGDEPAGCARIRYFGDFAKIERLSVLSQYRRTKLKYRLVEFAEELVRQKGFNMIYGHPQRRILNFWTKLGYEIVNRNFEFHYSDHDYAEMRKYLDPHPEQLTMHSDPMVLVRPEGNWAQPGILEHSMERPATRPC